MSKNDAISDDHAQRINRVLNYIQDHLDERLNLKTLAGVACISPFHFHRLFTAYLGETLGEYIKRIRLEKAAHRLRHTTENIGEIGMVVGYETPSAFAKAFKQHFGVSPKIFRKKLNKVYMTGIKQINSFQFKEKYMQPKIIERPQTDVIYVRRNGAYDIAAEQAWQEICRFAVPRKLISKETESIGISYDDPAITETSQLRYDACLSITQEVQREGEVGQLTIAGGRYAVFLHKGPYANLNGTYKEIYSQWLPQSGCCLADNPCFEKYLNSPDEVASEKLQTEIYIPIL